MPTIDPLNATLIHELDPINASPVTLIHGETSGAALTFPEGAGAVTLDITAAGQAGHGIAGAGAAEPEGLTAEGEGEGSLPLVGDGAFTLDDPLTDGQAAHGIAAEGLVTIEDATAEGQVVHGIAGAGAVTLGVPIIVGDVTHPRHVLRGEVRDQGVLVNRTVRAYLRTSGEMIAEQLTVGGRFDLHTGFEPREFYITPIDLSALATDWAPPTANRVIAVLAMDT